MQPSRAVRLCGLEKWAQQWRDVFYICKASKETHPSTQFAFCKIMRASLYFCSCPVQFLKVRFLCINLQIIGGLLYPADQVRYLRELFLHFHTVESDMRNISQAATRTSHPGVHVEQPSDDNDETILQRDTHNNGTEVCPRMNYRSNEHEMPDIGVVKYNAKDTPCKYTTVVPKIA